MPSAAKKAISGSCTVMPTLDHLRSKRTARYSLRSPALKEVEAHSIVVVTSNERSETIARQALESLGKSSTQSASSSNAIKRCRGELLLCKYSLFVMAENSVFRRETLSSRRFVTAFPLWLCIECLNTVSYFDHDLGSMKHAGWDLRKDLLSSETCSIT